jgi:hypothetical protein
MVNSWIGKNLASLWRSKLVRIVYLLSISLFAIGCAAEQSISFTPDAVPDVSIGDVSINSSTSSESLSTAVPPPATLTVLPTSAFEDEQPPAVGSVTAPAGVSPTPTLISPPTILAITPPPSINPSPTLAPTAAPAASNTPVISPTIEYPLFSRLASQFRDGRLTPTTLIMGRERSLWSAASMGDMSGTQYCWLTK